MEEGPCLLQQTARPAGRLPIGAGTLARLAAAEAGTVARVVELGQLAAALTGYKARRAGAPARLAGGGACALAQLPRGVHLGHIHAAAAAEGQTGL